MDEIVTEYAAGILRIQLNRPTAMTSAMYVALADIFNAAEGRDHTCRPPAWRGGLVLRG